MCLPTWIGPVISLISIVYGDGSLSVTYGLGFALPIVLVLDGLFASGCVWIINTIQERLEKDG